MVVWRSPLDHAWACASKDLSLSRFSGVFSLFFSIESRGLLSEEVALGAMTFSLTICFSDAIVRAFLENDTLVSHLFSSFQKVSPSFYPISSDPKPSHRASRSKCRIPSHCHDAPASQDIFLHLNNVKSVEVAEMFRFNTKRKTRAQCFAEEV
jgi:hypothetical protein